MTKPRVRKHADGSMSIRMDDSFANMVSGLGAFDLKARANTYIPPIDTYELEAAYRTSTWFGKIIDIPAEDSIREWRTWQMDNNDVGLIEAEERRLGLQQKTFQARKWARLYGGSAIVIGGLSGRPEEPLRLNSVRKGSIKFLSVLTRNEISCGPLVRNPMDERYGYPEYFELNGTGTRVHPSRIVTFQGPKVNSITQSSEFWGDPVWFRLEAAIKSADQSGAVIDALMQEAKVDVLRVSGMTKGLATKEYEALMIRRFQMVAVLKGMQNVMLLDKDDEWEQKQIEWNGLPDVAKHVLNILSGASDIPMFRLTGQNLTGLSNSGDTEQRAYYDGVRSKQNLELRPELDPLDRILLQSAVGSLPADAWYEWESLYQMTEKEKAEVDKLEAETANVYQVSGLIPSEALATAVQARMIDSGRWGALEAALVEEPDEEEDSDEDDTTRAMLEAADAAPRSLYVRRDVLNWEEIAAWAKDQGFETTLGSDMHVTVVYSKRPIDWMKMGESWEEEVTVAAGGPRLMEAFGDDGQAAVLLFRSSSLEYRHLTAMEAGASWDHEEYQPHITISWTGLPEGIEPYKGRIVLGPEIFEEINPDWKSNVTEDGAS